MSKFDPRKDRPLWIEDSGLSTAEIEEALEPAMKVLEAAGLTPEQAHAQYMELVEAGDQEAIHASIWAAAERAIPDELFPPGAHMALG